MKKLLPLLFALALFAGCDEKTIEPNPWDGYDQAELNKPFVGTWQSDKLMLDNPPEVISIRDSYSEEQILSHQYIYEDKYGDITFDTPTDIRYRLTDTKIYTSLEETGDAFYFAVTYEFCNDSLIFDRHNSMLPNGGSRPWDRFGRIEEE